MLSVVAGVINELLLIPDLLLIHRESRVIVTLILLRTVFSTGLFAAPLTFYRIKNCFAVYRLMTFFEAAAFALFLFVMSLYNPPDFMIQSMGLFVLLSMVFLFPNRFWLMIVVAVMGTAGFFVESCLIFKNLQLPVLQSAAVYLLIDLVICAIYAQKREHQQYLEFLARNELMERSSTDPLTKAYSRGRLFDEFEIHRQECLGLRQPMSLSLFDIDRFKAVNDGYGHTLADNVLVSLVQTVKSCIRGTDMLVRWGGDEFVILFPGISARDGAKILDRIRTRVEETEFSGGIHITCSFGIAEMKENASLDSMVQAADDLMYKGKRMGGNRVEL